MWTLIRYIYIYIYCEVSWPTLRYLMLVTTAPSALQKDQATTSSDGPVKSSASEFLISHHQFSNQIIVIIRKEAKQKNKWKVATLKVGLLLLIIFTISSSASYFLYNLIHHFVLKKSENGREKMDYSVNYNFPDHRWQIEMVVLYDQQSQIYSVH